MKVPAIPASSTSTTSPGAEAEHARPLRHAGPGAEPGGERDRGSIRSMNLCRFSARTASSRPSTSADAADVAERNEALPALRAARTPGRASRSSSPTRPARSRPAAAASRTRTRSPGRRCPASSEVRVTASNPSSAAATDGPGKPAAVGVLAALTSRVSASRTAWLVYRPAACSVNTDSPSGAAQLGWLVEQRRCLHGERVARGRRRARSPRRRARGAVPAAGRASRCGAGARPRPGCSTPSRWNGGRTQTPRSVRPNRSGPPRTAAPSGGLSRGDRGDRPHQLGDRAGAEPPGQFLPPPGPLVCPASGAASCPAGCRGWPAGPAGEHAAASGSCPCSAPVVAHQLGVPGLDRRPPSGEELDHRAAARR